MNQGFRIAAPDTANYIATLSYAISDPKTSTSVYTGTRTESAYIDFQNIYYSVPDVQTETRTEYTRTVQLMMIDKGTDKSVFESRVVSIGGCGIIATVIDEMATAMFKSFPAGSGSVAVSVNHGAGDRLR